MKLAAGVLCEGIAGVGLGLERAGMTVKWCSEVDPFCCDVLGARWPHVPNHGDISSIDWSSVEPVDLVAAGYPCQPFSYAGLRRGADDERHLWPYVFDAIRVLRPRYALLENVPGHLSLGFDTVLADLASIGFDAQWSVVSACALGAPHTRRRLFCLAYPARPDGQGEMPRLQDARDGRTEPRGSRRDASRAGRWLPEPEVDRIADGVPRRLVGDPLHALGNAVVPAVAEHIGRLIVAAHEAVTA